MTRRPRDQRGQVTVLIVGLCAVLAMGVAVVTDASAAYLQRQGLDSLADGAALAGADLGASGEDVYGGGLVGSATGGERLDLTAAAARAAVHDYLVRTGAFERYPGLRAAVEVDAATRSVRVRLTAPLHLPLKVPGGQESALIGATGAAVTAVDP